MQLQALGGTTLSFQALNTLQARVQNLLSTLVLSTRGYISIAGPVHACNQSPVQSGLAIQSPAFALTPHDLS